MHSIQTEQFMRQMMSFLYRIGFWHRGKGIISPIARRIHLLYCIYYFIFFISLVVGAFTSDNGDDSVILVEAALIVAVMSIKMWFIMWKQKQIIDLLNRISVFSIRNYDDYNFVNGKLRRLMEFAKVFLLIVGVANVCITIVVPLLGNEKNLFVKVAFPLDWKNSDIAFFLANAFVSMGIFLTMPMLLLSIMIWYLMFCCSLRYKILGNDIRNMGVKVKCNKKWNQDQKNQNVFLCDLNISINAHLHIKKYNYV